MYNHLNWGLRHFADQSEDMILLIIANANMFNYEPYLLSPESFSEYSKTHLHSCRYKWRVYWNNNGRDEKKIPPDYDPRVWREWWRTREVWRGRRNLNVGKKHKRRER